VLVDKDRVKAGRHAIRQYGVDTLVLDDGFQYLPLKGRLNLLLVDKTNPFGNENLLPRGILREPIEHLRRASYIFITKSDGEGVDALRKRIRAYNPHADVIECTHKPQYLKTIDDREEAPLSWMEGKKVAALSGIAVPESFEAFLVRFGAEIRYAERYLDHHRFSSRELKDFLDRAEAAGAEAVITTEKDAVRIDPHLETCIPVYYLRLEIDILDGAQDFEEAVSRICFPKTRIKGTRSPLLSPPNSSEA